MNLRRETSTSPLLAARQRFLPRGWVSCLKTGLLIWLIVLGHRPSFAPAWLSFARPLGSETNRPVEESPTESPESQVAGEHLYHGQRHERSLAADVAHCKLPPNHLTGHFSRGRGFLIAESCFGSEHALRNGTGGHLRC